MAIDPKKLAAFGNGADKGGPPKKGGGGPPPKKGGGPPADEEMDDEHDDGGEDDEGGDELADKFGDIIEKLESNTSPITEEIDMLDREMLTDPGTEDPDFLAAIGEASDQLDPSLVELMDEKLSDVSWEDAVKIAEHLRDEGKGVEDADAFAGFLFHFAHRN